jgi:hypothetical protein
VYKAFMTHERKNDAIRRLANSLHIYGSLAGLVSGAERSGFWLVTC